MDINNPETKKTSKIATIFISVALVGVAVFGVIYFMPKKPQYSPVPVPIEQKGQVQAAETNKGLQMPELDIVAYDKKMLELANLPQFNNGTSSPPKLYESKWPVQTVYPNPGALLPFNRIVAYYGNLYSKGMGVLGEYSEDEVLRRLTTEVGKWEKADPTTPVIPALHYIAVVAQAGPGKDGKYRARMPDKEIDKVLAMAQKINALVFLDIQVASSNVQVEVPLLEKYLKLPNVHLGIDPEFSMKDGSKPGTKIGTMDAKDINFTAEYLANIVKENNLTPKMLIVHRFTRPMITNYKKITPLPEVQIVMDMDGFGSPASKNSTYKSFIYSEPVQFTGFKLFYKNDVARGGLVAPADILKLTPIPSYIQYQ